MQLKLACADFTFPILPHEQVLVLISMLTDTVEFRNYLRTLAKS